MKLSKRQRKFMNYRKDYTHLKRHNKEIAPSALILLLKYHPEEDLN